jgi:hypothetical protein
MRFSTIFGEKIGVFLKYQCYDQNFALFSFVLSEKRQHVERIIIKPPRGEKYTTYVSS